VLVAELIDPVGNLPEPFLMNFGIEYVSILRSRLAASVERQYCLAGRVEMMFSDVIPNPAYSDAINPGPELIIITQMLEFQYNRQQRILYDILGDVTIRNRAQDKRINPLPHNNGQMSCADPITGACLAEQFSDAFIILSHHNTALIQVKAAVLP